MPKRSDPTIKQHKITFRPIEPPADLPNYDNWPRVCVPVPAPFIPYLLNLLRVYLWQGRWDADPATAALAVQAWNDLVHQFVIAGECENMIILRQNPLDDCLLEQSHDGGQTWTTAFNYSLCKPKMSYTEINNSYTEATTTYNDIFNRYDGTAESLMPFAGATDEPVRNSLCLCCHIFISAVSDMVVTLKKQADSEGDANLNSVAAALGAGSAVAGGVAGLASGAAVSAALVAAAPWLAVGLAAGALSMIVAQAFNNTDLSIYEDQAAWDELACIVYQGLKDRPINQTVFSASISSGTPESANALELQSQIQPFFDSLELYLIFLDAWAKAREIFLLEPDVWECPCADEEEPPLPGWDWEYTYNFMTSAGGWQNYANGLTQAAYVFGCGFRARTASSTGCNIESVAGVTATITEIAVTFSRQDYVLPAATASISFIVGDQTIVMYQGQATVQDWTHAGNYTTNGQRLYIFAGTGNSSVPLSQTLCIQSVTIRGTGVNPFA